MFLNVAQKVSKCLIYASQPSLPLLDVKLSVPFIIPRSSKKMQQGGQQKLNMIFQGFSGAFPNFQGYFGKFHPNFVIRSNQYQSIQSSIMSTDGQAPSLLL